MENNNAKKVHKVVNFIFRLIVWPLIVFLLLFAYIKSVLTDAINWLLFGGEVMIYNRKSFETIHSLLKKLIDEKGGNNAKG